MFRIDSDSSEVRSRSTILINKSRSTLMIKKSTILSPKNVRTLDSIEQFEELRNNVNDKLRNLFGNFDLETVFYNRYQALGVYDASERIVGAVILAPYPNIPAISPRFWEDWFHQVYGLKIIDSRNALWIHLVLYEPMYYNFFLVPLIQNFFKERPMITYCLLIVPPGNHDLDFFNNMGVAVLPKGETMPKKLNQHLYLITRNNFLWSYKLRKAVEEDNDDLIPLIDAYCPIVKNTYGSFYIAEILTKYKECGRQILVSEHEGVPVGVLCLNEYVNLEVLNEQFELVPFNGLKKPHKDDKIDLFSETYWEQADDDVIREQSDKNLSIISNYSYEMFDICADNSDEFILEFTGHPMFLFLDDDEGSLSISTDESIHAENQDAISHFLKQSKHTQRLSDDHMYSLHTLEKDLTTAEFHGESNAFALEIAATHPDHENSLMSLFEAAFHCFSDREYCVMMLPSDLSISKIFKYFSRVVPRPTGNLNHELYVMHRNAILGRRHVKEITDNKQIEEIKNFLDNIQNGTEILNEIKNSLMPVNSIYKSFALLCDKQIIGLATVKKATNIEYLKIHYNLSVVLHPMLFLDRQGMIENVIISPIFQRHANYFAREIHVLSQYDILYYKLKSDTTNSHSNRPLMHFLDNMIHIMPRPQPQYDLKVLEENDCLPPKVVTSQTEEQYALFVSSLAICGTSKFIINHKIVVVGCSSTALSFLEALIFNQNPCFRVLFNNVTLVCDSNLIFKSLKIQDTFLVKKHFIDFKYLNLMGMKSFVNFIQGNVTKIKRKEKTLIINYNTQLKYDYLFLMFGEKYRKPLKSYKHRFEETPDNVFVVNNHIDVNKALISLKILLSHNRKEDYMILICGHTLRSFCAVEGLLEFGIKGKHLTFIENFPYNRILERKVKMNVSIFNYPAITEVVIENLKAAGITIYSSYYFVDWTYDKTRNIITSAKFESQHKMLEIKCLAMFIFNNKDINHRLQKVIREAGLVYDGRLVIDHECRTNDPCIYAAGTLTKYSRRYFAQMKSHKYYNRIEIGQHLGLAIKRMLSPHRMQKFFREKSDWDITYKKSHYLVPTYCKPIMRYCKLPGGLYYLSIVKPGPQIPLETAISSKNYGRVLITGNCNNLSEQGFFRIHLNNNRRVETITCLSKFPLNIRNLYCLWGKNEQLLNNLIERFDMVLITDFFDYFRQPWAYAIYHDKFNDLLEELNYLMTSTIGEAGSSILKTVINEYSNVKWKQLSDDTIEEIENDFKKLPYAQLIEQKVLNFLRENISHLPMYAHPVIVRDILNNFEHSPMFT